MSGEPTRGIDEAVIASPWPTRAWDRMAEAIADLALHIAQRRACHFVQHPRTLPLPVRRLGRVLWWTLTLQLPLHAVYWVRARRARRAAARLPRPVPAPPPPADHIRLHHAAHPAVSVIIPTFGQVPCTLRCLAAIAEHPSAAPIEVIVVDDASDDPAVAQLDRVSGIRLIRQPRNLGYLRTCNEAEPASRQERRENAASRRRRARRCDDRHPGPAILRQRNPVAPHAEALAGVAQSVALNTYVL